MPVDLVIEGPTVGDPVKTDFARGLRQNLQEAHEGWGLKQSARHQKRNYDQGAWRAGGRSVRLAFNKSRRKEVPEVITSLGWTILVVKKLSDVTYRIQRKPGSKLCSSWRQANHTLARPKTMAI